MSIIVQRGKSLEQVFEFFDKTSKEQVIVEVEKNAKFKGIVLISKMNKCDISFEVRVHEGADADLWVLALGQEAEQGSFRVNIIHLEPNTRANVQVKAVLDGQSKLTFDGLIKVMKPAQKTQSYLREDVLLLSKDAQSLGKPQLEIEANDVKVSHGSTIGRVDDEQLFYLTSRGIEKEAAKKVIVDGFIGTILSKISASN